MHRNQTARTTPELKRNPDLLKEDGIKRHQSETIGVAHDSTASPFFQVVVLLSQTKSQMLVQIMYSFLKSDNLVTPPGLIDTRTCTTSNPQELRCKGPHPLRRPREDNYTQCFESNGNLPVPSLVMNASPEHEDRPQETRPRQQNASVQRLLSLRNTSTDFLSAADQAKNPQEIFLKSENSIMSIP